MYLIFLSFCRALPQTKILNANRKKSLFRSGGISSGILSYRIDEETDDVDDEQQQRSNSTAVEVAENHTNPFTGGNGTTVAADPRHRTEGNSREVAADKPVTIDLATQLEPTPAPTQQQRRSFFDQLYNPAPNHRNRDVEDPDEDDDDDFGSGGDGETFSLTRRNPKKPTITKPDKKTTDEEMRPLSNGFVLQKSWEQAERPVIAAHNQR